MLLHTLIHPALASLEGRTLVRLAARAIVLDGEDILLLYTRRYNDYSFPGGGLDAGEDVLAGLQRELIEETGACNVRIGRYYGYVDEYRPHFKPDYDLLYMRSHFYFCDVERVLGEAAMEGYEKANGMVPTWINIHQAIAHNQQIITEKPACMGMSIERETLMLKQIAGELR